MSKSREQELLRELGKLAFVASGVMILIFSAIYFFVEGAESILPAVREFVLGITVNLIPIFLIFVVSYALFRRIQTIKSEHETDELIEKIAGKVRGDHDELPEVAADMPRHDLGENELLVQDSETSLIYLLDRFRLPRPIKDKNTALYLAEVLGYQPDELPKAPPEALRPLGPEVIAIRTWSPPRTKEDEMSLDAQYGLKLLKKSFRTEDGSRILSFFIRNDSEHNIQINSAELVFDVDAPVTGGDISPKNKPAHVGLLTCKLLFDGVSEARKLTPQEESRLDLILQRHLSEEEADRIISLKLGYIKITGVFRDTQVMFHKDA